MLALYRIILAVVLLVALMFGVYLVGVKTTVPKPEVITAAPQAVQSDASIVVERKPDVVQTKPPHQIPKGSKEERRIGIKLRPDAFVSAEGCRCEPAPVGINLSLVRDEQGRRVVTSATGGQIVGALDVPIEATLMPPEPHPWAAGLSYGQDKSPGIWIERDLGRIRIGAELIRERTQTFQARARVGLVW